MFLSTDVNGKELELRCHVLGMFEHVEPNKFTNKKRLIYVGNP